MKRITALLIATFAILNTFAADPEIGKISITPYVADNTGLNKQAQKLFMNKLNQIVTQGSATGGFDKTFIITSSVNILEESETNTIPQKTSLRASFTFYVGNGIDGTLFNTCTLEATGIGDNHEKALLAAIRKINANNSDLQALIAEGKERIVTYYNTKALALISEAEGLIARLEYEKAIILLGSIPFACDHYTKAQELIAECGRTIINNQNEVLYQQAKSAWSASPDANGAQEASKFLAQILPTTPEMQKKVDNLNEQIRSRLLQIDKLDRDMEKAILASEEKVRIAEIKAAESVLNTYYSHPATYNVVYWW